MKKKEDEVEEVDPRLEFLFEYLTQSYGLRQEIWNKFLTVPEHVKLITNFFDTPTIPLLLVTLSPGGVLLPSYEYDSQLKGKFTYFRRKREEKITVEEFQELVSFGDMAGKPVEELAVLINGFCLPILNNPENQRGWPKVVADDVKLHVRSFKNVVDQVRGAMKSQTVLPMPKGTSHIFEAVIEFTDSDGEKYNLNLKSSIEDAMLVWDNICRDALKQDSKAAFAGGANPTPTQEVTFWEQRLRNLEYIYDQLRDPRVKKLGEYLELTNSSYSNIFKKMFKTILAGVVEARDIAMYLKTFVPHIARFEENDFLDNKPYIKPLIHVIALIWVHSKYYSFSEKIVVLLREVSNLLIEAAVRQLHPESIFQGEPDDTFVKLGATIEMLELFMKSFEYVRKNLPSYYERFNKPNPQPWTFHPRNVFQRLMGFMDRLRLVHNIIGTGIEFFKLEKVEIGGLKGRILSLKCEEIFEDFTRVYTVFANIQYDILDIEDDNVYKDDGVFREKCADLDIRLASVFTQAYDECYNLESIFKLLNIIGNLIDRPIIRDEITVKYPIIVKMLDEEVATIKETYDDGMKNGIPSDTYYPPVAGFVSWLMKLRERITKPSEQFKQLEHKIVQSDDAVEVFEKISEMLSILEGTLKDVLDEWFLRIPDEINTCMMQFQMVRDPDDVLQINFDPKLEAILKEIRYLKMLQIENIPDEGIALFERLEELHKSVMRFKRIEEYYNHLKRNTLEVEYNIIADEVSTIDNTLEPAISSTTWFNNDTNVVESMYEAVKKLYDRVVLAQTNIKNLLANIDLWANIPLYERKDGKKENLLNLEDRPERIQRRYDQITNSAKELAQVLVDNYNLYFDITPEPASEEADKIEDDRPVGDISKGGDDPSLEDNMKGAKKETDKKKEVKKPKKQSMDTSGPEPKVKMKEAEKTKSAFEGNEIPEQIVQTTYMIKQTDPFKTPKKSKGQTPQPLPPPAVIEEKIDTWTPYLIYIDNVMKGRLLDAITISQTLFLEEMGESDIVTPFFEISMELREPDIVFEPSVDEDDSPNFLYMVRTYMDDMYNMGCYLNRTEPEFAEETFYAKLLEDKICAENYEEISSRILLAMDQATQYVSNFDDFEHLWLDNRQEYLRHFLLYSRQLTDEEKEQLKDENVPPLKEVSPTNDQFREQIDFYDALYNEVKLIPDEKIQKDGWLRVVVKPLKQAILNVVCKWGNLFKQHLYNHVINSLDELENFIVEAIETMLAPLADDDYDGLIKVMGYLWKVKERVVETDAMFQPLQEVMDLLQLYNVEFPEEIHVQLQEIPDRWIYCKKVAATTKQAVAPLQAVQVNAIKRRLNLYEMRQNIYRTQFKMKPFFRYDCKNMYSLINDSYGNIQLFETEQDSLREQANLFELIFPDFKAIRQARKEITQIKQLWDYVNIVMSCMDEWKTTLWKKIDVDSMEFECKRFSKDFRAMDKELRVWDVFINAEASIKNLLTSLRAVTELQNPAIRERHWQQLMQATKVPLVMSESTTLSDLLELNLHDYEDEVKNIVDKAVKEMAMEKILKELNAIWSVMTFSTEPHARTRINLLMVSEELIETLEENQTALQNMMGSKFIDFFLEEVSEWQIKLSNADLVINSFMEVQRKWMYLESIFICSEDIRQQLPEDTKRFDAIDREFKDILNTMGRVMNVVNATNISGLYDRLENLQEQLTKCEKALNEYLETKRLAFPRFYFVSSADLLDILANGNQPELIQRHLTKLFDSLAKLVFQSGTKKAQEMISKENDEHVKFKISCDCVGKVEIWLDSVIQAMRKTLHSLFSEAVVSYEEKPREVWIFDYPAQPALCGTQIWWTTEVNLAFERLEEGYENALKDYQKKQISQLNALITLLLGDLKIGDRQKIMTICTIDVHSRDVVFKMISIKVENSQAFQWQSQLRHRWDDAQEDCFANICDARFRYQYEYLGNTPRLVITPLTDRCYITLTQSLHLVMGGAPAGPAGTGKTETTKDLGKALGMMVYVFNCSEQMDYKSIGNIYKGLAQTGCWGCFDEFNRISIEVLSVVAVQVKTIQDAMKENMTKFWFLEQNISLIPTVGIFITMNPGYAGRTELPENLKALFRPCAMVVPDFELICEIMLVAEGFLEARMLARKFLTLYSLCKELLSKQDHYDWGLRAIKSVLVVAGSLKRGDKTRPEDQVLMRALRDFNIPKIVTDDVPIFMGLIGDLFPALDVPRQRNPDFESIVKKSAIEMKLQPEEGFILKIVQLEELLAVRHSVFIVGFTGTGKSMVWKTLFKTYQVQKRKPVYNDINPKAVTNDELFGVINPSSREWRDGLFSVIMRDQANLINDSPKWIVLDGDIDPMWIESLNTLMDDNKVLTLASNERIALTTNMRLLFEIATLRTATPATVSRAGILYINPSDLGWNPYIASWIDTRTVQSEKTNLIILFDKYVPLCLDMMHGKLKKITPIADTAHLQMLCFLLDCFLTPQNVPVDCPKEWYEIYFAFSCIWAFGSSLFQDQITDWRNEFSKWFLNEFKAIKFPAGANVFSYYIDDETKRFVPWSELVQTFELDVDVPLQATLVDTTETTRIKFFLDRLMGKKIPVMLVGPAGSGKTVIINEKLENLSEKYAVTKVPFNFYTTSQMLQSILEKPLEKKAGRVFGPPSGKTMIYFIDDMNMPEVDKYFTVQPHTLMKQYMDYQHWFDRQKLCLKEIHDVQFLSSMNPTAGSFRIDPRLQRHFCVFAVSFPSYEASFHIYHNIISQHLNQAINKFSGSVTKHSTALVNTALTFHAKIGQTFLPTATKFHYIFTLRDVSNVFQGMLFTTGDAIKTQTDLIRLWMHESNRVYGDKLVNETDMGICKKLMVESIKKEIEDFEDTVFEEPLIFCHFAEGIGDAKYSEMQDFEVLSKSLEEALINYNELVAAMNLVLFNDAIYHICRINRILESPRGNALLVGVGGSGKQSLTRLAAFISSFDVFQIQLKKDYTLNDMKLDLAALYLKTGIKMTGIVFLITDAQIPKENFLVMINDMLASGEVSELLNDEEVEKVFVAMRTDVLATGLPDTKENCWKFFIDRVRKLLKTVLCFSPVGSTLRVRSRKFPALVNCSSIDWFHEWPQEALESVSKRFLEEIETLPNDLVDSVSLFMSYVHTTVNNMSEIYLANEKRYNYTTPKSFLEQISLYSKLLTEKTRSLTDNIEKLELGLTRLASTSEEVAGLKDVLAVQEVALNIKNEAAGKLIAVLTVENDKAAAEQQMASEEEAKVKIIEEDVRVKAAVCALDLQRAEPALIAAQHALNTLNKNNLTELKSFSQPPTAVVNVCAAVLILFTGKGKIPRDQSWKACKVMMGKVDQFLHHLITYDKDNIRTDVVNATLEYTKHPDFSPEKIISKSAAAAGLCAWVINILKYHDVFVFVEPKRQALEKANRDLREAHAKLAYLNDKLSRLEEQLTGLRTDFDFALNEKMICQAEADATALSIDLANRLVNGLGSENVRWRELIKLYEFSITTLPGDILSVTSFISYVGCFTRKYRVDLLNKYWIPYLLKLNVQIPRSDELDPLSLLTDGATIAQWNNDGLPTDRMSSENACILLNSARWPLLIDPQLQGIKWIKTMFGEDLKVIRLTTTKYLDIIELAVAAGQTVLMENIGETLDAVLDPLLARTLIKKGTAIRIGDKELDFDPHFKLIIHTKLANPHYKPEIQAQTTLINFTVTRDGLEEQLLAEVVKHERADLEQLKSSFTKQQNDFKILLKKCEDNLLYRLSSATGNILGDVELVENLEMTKRTALEIESKVEEAKITSVKIDEAREQYRGCAIRGSLLYFVLNDLNKVNAIYQFSLKAFSVVFKGALERAEASEKLKERVLNLLDNITYEVFMYTSRGLFECDKLTFLAQMTFQILLKTDEITHEELDFLLRFPIIGGVASPVDFLSNTCWGGIKSLSTLDEFKNLDKDLVGSAKRWLKFVDSECPEKEKFPGDWKNKSLIQRLTMMRALRPDRMTYSVRCFVEEKLGAKYVTSRSPEFEKSYNESSSSTPIFFILSPGVNPLKDVERLGKKLGFTFHNGTFHSVSLGQGQEIVADNSLDLASTEGHWVILQNIHLVVKWLPSLEKKMESCSEEAHPDFRLYLSAEPSANPALCDIPQGILESCIKITNEPPTGMFANLHKALDNFSQETLEICSKEAEFKTLLFSLCYFHAVVAERRKFGPQGWNRNYPFNVGDLTISVNVLFNYLESNARVPYEDLRYLFGEIMYGGHITDDWDRRLCKNYLLEYVRSELLEGEMEFAPGFAAPPNTDYEGYHNYIDECLPPEGPYLYGLHPNAEIGFLANTSEIMFRTIFELQPREAGASSGEGMSREDKVKSILEDIMDKMCDPFNVADMMSKVEDRTPYVVVALQECDRMNNLTSEIRRSLSELELGLKGELTITADMEALEQAIFFDLLPESWSVKAYPSLLPLGQWIVDLTLRIKELDGWTSDFALPSAIWLGGLFNPQSFLTAVMQQTARKNEWPLDKMCLLTDVTKKQREEFVAPPREGAYVHGVFMEGAKWDIQTNAIGEAKLKELFPMMPVIFIKAITQDKQDLKGMYDCPVYKTRQRGATFVWTFNLKTREKPSKWTLAGVAILLQV